MSDSGGRESPVLRVRVALGPRTLSIVPIRWGGVSDATNRLSWRLQFLTAYSAVLMIGRRPYDRHGVRARITSYP